MKKINYLMLLVFVFAAACGGNDSGKPANSGSKASASKDERIAKRFGLTVFELHNGVGPIKEKLKLGPIDPAMVKKGEALFEQKCASCHKLDERFTGPAQRDLIERRSPEYIMNMILNPDEMLAKHPEAKKMLAIYMTKMTFQDVSVEEARDLLEFFRAVDKKK